MSSFNYIENITVENTGDGCVVDFVHLKSGKLLGITDEVIGLCNSLEHFYNDSEEFCEVSPVLYLPRIGGDYANEGISTWIKEIIRVGSLDYIILKNGLQIMVSSTKVCLITASLPL
jgi:hypothetical protein